MITRAMLRVWVYAMAAAVVLGIAFLLLVTVLMGLFGVGVVRSDHFVTFLLVYWFIGAPAAMLVSRSLAIERSKSDAG